MKSKDAIELSGIKLLLFRIGGLRIGLDMTQIAEMADLAGARARRMPLHWFHRLMSPAAKIHYRSPVALVVRTDADSWGVVVDHPEAVDVPLSLNAVHSLPFLIEAARPGSAVWGAAIIDDDGIILLVDLYKLPSESSLSQTHADSDGPPPSEATPT